jgi:hypothetical protein
MSAEVEPMGITYDRYRLGSIQADLAGRFGWRRVLEVGASGAKAKPYIYSLGFARAGCSVDLLGADPGALEDFHALGLEDRVRVVEGDLESLPAGSWDVAWNFVTASTGRGLAGRLARMARVAMNVMTVHTNGLHLGRPWHRLLHAAMGIPWDHASFENEFPGTVGLAYREAGLATAAAGFFDSPGWPDPPGPRDLRMHIAGVTGNEATVEWRAPVVEIYRTGRVPLVLRILEMGERLQPLPVKAVMAHLYFHVGAPA